ncbi:MAG: AAA family ATPase [Bacteroidia bacterium]|nr:AAA family ATPase [Bacteroidia bacterium]
MVGKVNIQNYKSISDLSLELGRFNIFIGENGCGKSNILEAVTLGAAQASRMLNNEFLSSRGIRVTSSPMMRSAFQKGNLKKSIQLSFEINEFNYQCEISNANKPYSPWVGKDFPNKELIEDEIIRFFTEGKKTTLVDIKVTDEEEIEKLKDLFRLVSEVLGRDGKGRVEDVFRNSITKTINENVLKSLTDFLIFSPENTSLRTFEREGQIEPLGITGEGLFKLLKTLGEEKGQKKLTEIKEELQLFDWFQDFEVPKLLYQGEEFLKIKDRFVHKDIELFDQRNANEGFLFLLFYFALFISDKTPNFFAIDNIEASLNPKLCFQLTKRLNFLSQKYDKQVILTTHNPSILDGIDLKDSDQRLFVIFRNKLGHTKARRIQHPEILDGIEPVKLSEAFLRGYIGGLPRNF